MEAINGVSSSQPVSTPVSPEPLKQEVKETQPAPPSVNSSSSSDENHIIDITG